MFKRNPNARHPFLDKLYLMFVAGWYSTNDPTSKDRCRHLACNYTSNIIANLIGGTFWSGLLLLMNADDSFIGTASMISTGANMLQLLAPLLLERFPRRRTLLTILRATVYLINILFIGLIPLFPMSQQGRLTILALSILVVNLISALSAPGLSVWHIQLIPDRVRKNYFGVITMTNGAVVALFNLLGSRIVDWFKQYDMEYQGLLGLRLFSLALAAIEIYLYFHMKEEPYEKSDKAFSLKDLTLPLKNKSYLMNVLCTVLWNYAVGIPSSYHSIYMLRDVGVSYSYVMLISLLCTPIAFIVSPIWNKLLSRFGWFKVLGISVPLYIISYACYGFTTKSLLFLYAVAALAGSAISVGINMGFSGVPYANIPAKNSTVYIAFYSTMANCAALLGVATGKYFMLATEGITINVLGVTMINNQYLMLLSCAMLAIAGVGMNYIAAFKRREELAAEAAENA